MEKIIKGYLQWYSRENPPKLFTDDQLKGEHHPAHSPRFILKIIWDGKNIDSRKFILHGAFLHLYIDDNGKLQLKVDKIARFGSKEFKREPKFQTPNQVYIYTVDQSGSYWLDMDEAMEYVTTSRQYLNF